ncbi:MAG TPA: alcohol dehydrogenase catalytic domain-containing protein [Candidatus Dormibacteraeota bacterium]|jgi:threonine dehydrogenase-like Zn-dependent dehydrogenase|nr:alcohol dehydrogenase catalytic domain-containing protein [Candidatus Dormibacteraeota bacterium]
MRAVRVERPGEIGMIRMERPRPATGELLVQVGSVGICGSDLEILEGRRPAPYVRYPIVPGHEWAGTVVETGPGVQGIAAGEGIVAEGFRACGVCDRCKEGLTNLCAADYAETGFTHQGAFAEYVAVPARLAHRLPVGADLGAAAVLEPAACVAQGLLEAGTRPGMRAAVVGSGTLGLLAVSLLRLSSPSELVLFGTRPARLQLGLSLGASDTVGIAEVRRLASAQDRFDLVFEAATRPEGAVIALRLARRGGTVVLEGISGVERPAVIADTFALKHLRVQGVFGASGRAWRWIVELFASGAFDPAPLITHRFALDDYEGAFGALRDRSSGALKVQLTP